MLQTFTYCIGGAFLSAASAACAAVMVSAAATIAAAEPSRTPIVLPPPEIFIFTPPDDCHGGSGSAAGDPAPCPPNARLEASRFIPGLFILILLNASPCSEMDGGERRVVCAVSLACATTLRQARDI